MRRVIPEGMVYEIFFPEGIIVIINKITSIMYAMSVHIVFMLCAKYTNLEKWPKRRRAQYAHVNRLKVTDRLNDALYVI